MKLRTLLLFVLVAAFVPSAFAWPSCNGQWVSVPKNTAGGVLYSTGDLLFQCQPSTPSSPSPSSSSSSSASSQSASSASSSSATSSQQGQQQGQQQTANGGDATVSNSGGNSSNNYSSTTQVDAPKIPVATAYAPSVFPTVSCFKGYGAGVQTAPVGLSVGGGKIDENCAILEAAGRAHNLLTFCKIYISNKYAKKAGVTLEDCLSVPPPTPAPVVQTVFIPVPSAVIIPPTVTYQVVTPTLYVDKTPLAPRRRKHVKKRAAPCEKIVTRCTAG